jgi:hypothetical protein
MTKVIASLTLLVAVLIGGAFKLYDTFVPQPIANSVIAEKGEVGGQVGGQAAQLLPASMTAKQYQLLNLAAEVASENQLKSPELVQAVLLQETYAGGMKSYRVANPGPGAYFGAMQIKLSAAKDVLAAWPAMFTKYAFHTRTDDEIKANLILNDRFNIDVGTKYLLILKKRYGFSGRDLMNAYNRGPGGVKAVDAADFHYAIGAEEKLARFKSKR